MAVLALVIGSGVTAGGVLELVRAATEHAARLSAWLLGPSDIMAGAGMLAVACGYWRRARHSERATNRPHTRARLGHEQ